MSLSKSQIISKLKQAKYRCDPLDTRALRVVLKTDHPVKEMRTILSIFSGDGATVIPKSDYSSFGGIRVGNCELYVNPSRYIPKTPRGMPRGNPAVMNRMAFSVMLMDVLAMVTKPLNIKFNGGKHVKMDKVTSIRFSGKGVSDMTINQGTKKVPLAIQPSQGTYYHDLSGRYLDEAFDVLVDVTEDGMIDAAMEGDKMTLNAPIAYAADSRSIRELMFQDIKGGLGVVGDFEPRDFRYDGFKHELEIRCTSVYRTRTDLRADELPYFVITNSERGKIGDLEGLQVDLVPKAALPSSTNIVRAK